MMRSLWISKTGMEAQQMQLDTISNNLANVSTNGYKRSHAVFEDLMYQNLRQAGAASSEQTQLPTGLQDAPQPLVELVRAVVVAHWTCSKLGRNAAMPREAWVLTAPRLMPRAWAMSASDRSP